MTNLFKYSVLKYVHSQFLGEEINLGLIIQFNNPSRLVFKYPKTINRIKHLYKTADEKIIKQLLQAFERKANELNNTTIFPDLEANLSMHFLVRDAAPFQFGEIHTVTQYENDIEKITEHYYNLYFIDYEGFDQAKPIKDNDVSNIYRRLLYQKDESIKKLLQPPIELKNKTTHFKSDLVWRNGSINAVKGVSFDLKDERLISDKALLLQAKLNSLAIEAAKNNIRFDLLVMPPKQEELRFAYDNALSVLSEIRTNKEVISEDNLDSYISRTLKEIERG